MMILRTITNSGCYLIHSRTSLTFLSPSLSTNLLLPEPSSTPKVSEEGSEFLLAVSLFSA